VQLAVKKKMEDIAAYRGSPLELVGRDFIRVEILNAHYHFLWTNVHFMYSWCFK